MSWFRPPDPGFGTGFPYRWQGWLLLAIFFALVAAATYFWSDRPIILFSVILPLLGVFILIARAKTKGGWKWRNSRKEK